MLTHSDLLFHDIKRWEEQTNIACTCWTSAHKSLVTAATTWPRFTWSLQNTFYFNSQQETRNAPPIPVMSASTR